MSDNKAGFKEGELDGTIPPPAPFNLHTIPSASKKGEGCLDEEEAVNDMIKTAQGELIKVDLRPENDPDCLDKEDETTWDVSVASSCMTVRSEDQDNEESEILLQIDSNLTHESPEVSGMGEDNMEQNESTETRNAKEIEIIGTIETEDDQNLIPDSMPPLQNGNRKKGQFSRSKSRSSNNGKEKQSGDTSREEIKTAKQDEDIPEIKKNNKRLYLESNAVHGDYHSDTDSSGSSPSSLKEDETMPGLEEVPLPQEMMSRLSEPDFDVWGLGRDAMVDHLEYMYHDLGVTRTWRIPRATLRMFLLGVRERYQDNPYHNFKHCFCVTQMAYSMVCKLKLRHVLSADDLGMLITGAICHDVDHPGLNNGYHTHSHSPLAILYNYQSILEQHHFAVACRILTNKERNIFRNVPNRDEILNGTRELILATDLALHKGIMEEYRRNIADGFDFKQRSHVLSLLKIIIKCADVSNEVRPEAIAAPWVELLFSEYYEQSAREKRERLPVTPYMDPDRVDVTDSQEGFIKGMMLPMYNELGNLIVEAKLYYVNPLREALIRYEMQKRSATM